MNSIAVVFGLQNARLPTPDTETTPGTSFFAVMKVAAVCPGVMATKSSPLRARFGTLDAVMAGGNSWNDFSTLPTATLPTATVPPKAAFASACVASLHGDWFVDAAAEEVPSGGNASSFPRLVANVPYQPSWTKSPIVK